MLKFVGTGCRLGWFVGVRPGSILISASVVAGRRNLCGQRLKAGHRGAQVSIDPFFDGCLLAGILMEMYGLIHGKWLGSVMSEYLSLNAVIMPLSFSQNTEHLFSDFLLNLTSGRVL